MGLGNAIRRETNITVESSKSYSFGIRFLTADGLPLDPGSSELRFVAAEPMHWGGNEVLTKDGVVIPETTGFFRFLFQAEDLSLEPGSYPYDVTLVPVSGYSIPIIKGTLEVVANTDLDTSNFYSGIENGSDISVILERSDVVDITFENVSGLPTQINRPFTIGWIAGR